MMRHAVWWCALVCLASGLSACGSEEEAQAVASAGLAVQPKGEEQGGCGEDPQGGCGEQAKKPEPASPLLGRLLDTKNLAGVQQWYMPARGEGELELVVFFEIWCPHCRDEMPHLVELDAMPGVEVLALTRQSRGVTDEQVRAFVQQHQLPFGVAQVDEQLAQELGIRGIPRAVVVKDGAIVWDGHPARLSPEALKGWL